MRKILIILLLSVHFLSTTELGQLLKAPILISHFIEHQEEDAEITIWEYMVHHYGGHEKDADWETDMKLPFMKHADTLHLLTVPPNPGISLYSKVPAFRRIGTVKPRNDEDIPSSYLNTIWQPPKFC